MQGRLDGLHIITFGAEDNLGNAEEELTFFVNLDTSKPYTTIMIGNETPNLSSKFTLNSSTYITLISEDGMGSGIDFIWYSIDGGSTYYVYEEPFTIPNTTSIINFGAKDLLGNNASAARLSVIVDDREPVVEVPIEPEPEEEVTPPSGELVQLLMDYILFIIILLVVVILLAVIMRKRKGKEDVDFQAEPVITPQVVEMEIKEPQLVFEEEETALPPPPPPMPPPPPPKYTHNPIFNIFIIF